MQRQRGSARLFAVLGVGAALGIVAAGAFLLGRATARPRPSDPAARSEPSASPASPSSPVTSGSEGPPLSIPSPSAAPSTALRTLGDERLDAQVRAVVLSMDAKGRPPEGVAQGGRRGGPKGVFDNAEGKLPRKSRGYYRETDVWARGNGARGAERLVFGKDGEVYYTADHYRTFRQVR